MTELLKIQPKSKNTLPSRDHRSELVNITSSLYFLEVELKGLGLETASNLLGAASLSLKEELTKEESGNTDQSGKWIRKSKSL